MGHMNVHEKKNMANMMRNNTTVPKLANGLGSLERQPKQAKMFAVVPVADDSRDGRRAPKGVSLAVSSQSLKAFGTKNTVNMDVFWHLAGQIVVLRKFLPLVAK